MYSAETISKVKQMIADGLSDRVIAKRIKVSRQTVQRVRKGSSPGEKYRKQREKKERLVEAEKLLPRVVNPDSESYNRFHGLPTVKWRRCSTCGGKVQAHVECLACSQKKEMFSGWDCYLNELLAADTGTFPVLGLRSSINGKHVAVTPSLGKEEKQSVVDVGPQRAMPKSLAAIQAEVSQTREAISFQEKNKRQH